MLVLVHSYSYCAVSERMKERSSGSELELELLLERETAKQRINQFHSIECYTVYTTLVVLLCTPPLALILVSSKNMCR